jgi:HAD superfamily hydrolase (TIGR01509 family)
MFSNQTGVTALQNHKSIESNVAINDMKHSRPYEPQKVANNRKNKTYSWVFFDWDGCIADTLHLWIKTYEQVLPKYGLDVSAEEIWDKLCVGSVPKQYAIRDQAQCIHDTRKTALALFAEARLYNQAKDSLLAMSNHCKLAIVSNSPTVLLQSGLRRHQLEDLFASVIAKEDVEFAKPHPIGLFKTMERLKADPKQTLFVGDSHKDIEAARRAGVDSALFYPVEHEQLYDLDHLIAHEPTHIVSSFQEIKQLVIR